MRQVDGRRIGAGNTRDCVSSIYETAVDISGNGSREFVGYPRDHGWGGFFPDRLLFTHLFLESKEKKSQIRFFFWDREDFYIRKNRLSMQSIVWSSFYNHQDDHLDKVSDAFGEFVSLKQQGTHHTGLHGLVGYPLQPTTRRHPGRPLFR